MTEEEMENLAYILDYNGLLDYAIQWKEIGVHAPYDRQDLSCFDYAQLQVVWMYLVLAIGDYGTSPRYGWLKDVETFNKFIKKLEGIKERQAYYDE